MNEPHVEDTRPRTVPQERALRCDEQHERIEGRFRAHFDVHRGVHQVDAPCDFDVCVRFGELGASRRGAL